MLVVIRSAPGTSEASAAFSLARDLAADLVLLEDAVLFAKQGGLGGFCGTVHVLEDDLRTRHDGECESGIRLMNYVDFARLMAYDDKVIGAL